MESVILKLKHEWKKNGFFEMSKKVLYKLISLPLRFVDRVFDYILNSTALIKRVDAKSTAIAEGFSKQESISDADYKDYVETQVKKSYKSSSYIRFWQIWGRTGLIERLNDHLPNKAEREDMAILCVGCRDTRELNNVKKICGLKNITGLDLFSQDERIKVGDMHDMPFENNKFDILISVDNLEHAYDPEKALSEFRRVVKIGGIIGIEVPINYETNDIDRHDYKSVEHLLKLAGIKNKDAIIFQETNKGPSYQKIRILIKNP